MSTSTRLAPPLGSMGAGSAAVARAASTSLVARPVRAIPVTFWKAVTA
jgi:hypothetical protein